ncbi:hypothetical protein PYW08_008515 [Mythimna loreyi]|uniref:Uncharacterized protein n=1 Tax=Mythimna loreyi TaxID=667449 RepID=A0ACC2Q8N9_9NEOP|nr:hypothetical protein PYW08_008515 [Mythimna loreyi]
MCACKQKRSFLIEDILKDVKKKPYRLLSQEPTQPLKCNGVKPVQIYEVPKALEITKIEEPANDNASKHDTKCEVPKDFDLSKVNLEHRRNTYPLYPTPIKANVPPLSPSITWPQYRGKEAPGFLERPPFSYYSDPMLNSNQILRSQLAANRYVPHPFTIRQAYGFDRVPPSCCNPWWGLGGRRKGGQVRFTAAQTGALEKRFSASKYLSPDERRALASTLRLSDRQVKTWFQNRRAKWRRTTPDSADPGSPPTADEGSDDEVQIADDE